MLYKGRSCQSTRVLLVGPHPEKMQIIHSLASESKAKLFIFSASKLFSEWRSNAEKMIKVNIFSFHKLTSLKIMFQMGSYYSPAVIYMEDIDVLGSNQDDRTEWRRRVKTEFLVQCHTDSFEVENKETKTTELKPFIFIGGSENPWELDTAIRRRFEKRLCLSKLCD
jgi:vacuolar protein-sorting-associated protein 4